MGVIRYAWPECNHFLPKPFFMSATLWDSFSHLLDDARQAFMQGDLEKASACWLEYYSITAHQEYKDFADEIRSNWPEELTSESTPAELTAIWYALWQQSRNKKISPKIFSLYQELLVSRFAIRSQHEVQPMSVQNGIFLFLAGDIKAAQQILKDISVNEPENFLATLFLARSYAAGGERQAATSALTELLCLSADQITEDDLVFTQFRNLYNSIFQESGQRAESGWRLAFEAWYRNWLVFLPNEKFYKLMILKEQNERILRVKHYRHERYRHFVHCIYVVEYARRNIKKNQVIIDELEGTMKTIDTNLFTQYLRKRKPSIQVDVKNDE